MGCCGSWAGAGAKVLKAKVEGAVWNSGGN